MTQNSIIDSDFPSGVLFPARSSPIVCAADMLHLLLQLLYHIFTGASPPEAARRVVRERSWRPVRNGAGSATANQGEEEELLTLGNQHPRAHTVVFVLVVLPQAVKLFGMRGIPWTQVWGGLYLSSFLVIAGVGALARFGGNDNLTLRARETLGKQNMEGIRLGVVVGHAGMWSWLMWILLDSVTAKSTMFIPNLFGLVPLFLLSVCLLFALLVRFAGWVFFRHESPKLIFALHIVAQLRPGVVLTFPHANSYDYSYFSLLARKPWNLDGPMGAHCLRDHEGFSLYSHDIFCARQSCIVRPVLPLPI
jgi:hypothetical protein